LLEKGKYEAQINDIIQLSIEKIYQSKEVVEKEIAGYKVIGDLLEVFIRAVNNTYNDSATNYDKLILMLLPNKNLGIKNELYGRILDICSTVALFSDSYAIQLHKKIQGIDLY
jgi:dGTPase